MAHPGDSHADVVQAEICRHRASVLRTSFNLLRTQGCIWSPGEPLIFRDNKSSYLIDSGTTVWWRRPGKPSVADLPSEEARLTYTECLEILRGSLVSAGVRWVDFPWSVQLAENKLYQLSVALKLGIRIPRTIVTNVLSRAQTFAQFGDIIAKPVSAGAGLSPYADIVPREALSLIESNPVLLQELVHADSDIRIITIGKQVFGWSQSRRIGEPVDWRQRDNHGTGFMPFVPPEGLAVAALALAESLGLSTSVQDWLSTEDGYLFLEVNPQGQWLFLRESEELLTSFVAHLLRVT